MPLKQLIFLILGFILGWMTLSTSMAKQFEEFSLQQKHVDKVISLLEKIERNTR